MPLEFRYHDPQGTDEPSVWVSLSSNAVPFGTVQLSQAAELGEAATSGLEVEDPDGSWDFVGLRALTVYETSAPSNNQVILRGRIGDRSVSRGDSELTGAARKWSMDLVDYNYHLGKRIHVDADANRPAETAGDRLRWLLSAAAHISLHDHGHVTYPTQSVDATDYRGQRPLDLLADCAVEGGYNFWCEWNEAHNCSELFFMHPGESDYFAGISISNVLADIDDETTFAPDGDARLTRSAGRIAFGVYLPYSGGSVYVRNTTTRDQFTDIDQAAPMSNVKTAARATRVANKFLADHDTEEDKITCSIWLPAAMVNDIRPGQLVSVKFSHFPGYESAVYMRVTRRTVAQEATSGSYVGYDENADARYRVDLELSEATDYPIEETTPAAGCGLSESDAFYCSYVYGDNSTYNSQTSYPETTFSLVTNQPYRLVVVVDSVLRGRPTAATELWSRMESYGPTESWSPNTGETWMFDMNNAIYGPGTYYSDWYTWLGVSGTTGYIVSQVTGAGGPANIQYHIWVECQ
jgi:hypothetical protein